MALVQYYVFAKYTNPITKNTVTNTTTEKYNSDNSYLKSYDTTDLSDLSLMQSEMLFQDNYNNQKFDMLFYYAGVSDINVKISDVGIENNYAVRGEKFERCIGEAWFLSSTHTSLQSAMNAAKKIILAIGKDNVKITKNVPLELNLTVE